MFKVGEGKLEGGPSICCKMNPWYDIFVELDAELASHAILLHHMPNMHTTSRSPAVDCNIQENQTLDIVPRVNHPLLVGSGTDDIVMTRQELERMKCVDIRTLLKSKGLSTDGKKRELIDRYVNAQAAGFPPKKWPMTSAERKARYRAKQSDKKKQEVNEKMAKRKAQVRATAREVLCLKSEESCML